jgi:ABC-type branched-subunit amino acid transport system ATPase component
MSERRTILQTHGLTRRFGGLTAVDGLDIDVNDGEIVSLVGPNGAGKTTVFNLISGVLRPTAGSIRLLGRELVGQPAHRITHHGIARTFQNIRVFPQLTVRENILLGTHHWTRSGMLGSVTFWPGTMRAERAAQAEVHSAIDLFRERLEARLEDPAFTLSYAPAGRAGGRHEPIRTDRDGRPHPLHARPGADDSPD